MWLHKFWAKAGERLTLVVWELLPTLGAADSASYNLEAVLCFWKRMVTLAEWPCTGLGEWGFNPTLCHLQWGLPRMTLVNIHSSLTLGFGWQPAWVTASFYLCDVEAGNLWSRKWYIKEMGMNKKWLLQLLYLLLHPQKNKQPGKVKTVKYFWVPSRNVWYKWEALYSFMLLEGTIFFECSKERMIWYMGEKC